MVKTKLKIILLKFLDFLIENRFVYILHRIITFIYIKYVKMFYTINLESNKTMFSNEINKDAALVKQLRKRYTGIFNNLNVAFVCDGNRRWSKKNKIYKNKDKISFGLQKIEQIVSFLYFKGCSSISFYVFAIRNFKRAGEEIDAVKKQLKNQKIEKYSLKIRVYGDLSLFEDKEILKNIEQWETGSNVVDDDTFKINIFLAYNSKECDLDETNKRMFFDDKVDILIRTSGEKRLSDFMVKQVASGTAVKFISTLWPDLTLSQVFLILQQFKLENALFSDKKK